MFGKTSLFREYAGVIGALEHGERRPAQHRRPAAVTDSGFKSFATPAVEAVFEGFEYFGAVLNQHISDPWTIEETADTLVKDLGSDTPELGRTYDAYYNGVKLGRLQATDGFNPAGGFREDLDWHRQNRAARVLIDIDHLRFIPYDDAMSLVFVVEWFIGPWVDNDSARFRARAEATAALTGYLWEVQRAQDYVPDFSHRCEGPYDLLHQSTEHWKEGGIDPFERWNGDRLR